MSDILRGIAERSPLLALIHEQYPGYHPALALVKIANEPMIAENFDLQARIHMNLMQYITPKLAAQEIRQDINLSAGLLRVEYAQE